MFDEISPKYDFLNHFFTVNSDRRWRRKAVKRLEREAASCDTILDLAAGTGDLAEEFLRLNPQSLYSVDISSKMLQINQKKIRFQKHFLVQANAERLPFNDCFFDIVGIAFGVRNFEHLEDCIKETWRVLKPKGRFVTIEMFASGKQKGLFSWYFRRVIPKLGNMISGSKYAYNYLLDSVDTFMPVSEYSKLLVRNGFSVDALINNFRGIVYTVFASKN